MPAVNEEAAAGKAKNCIIELFFQKNLHVDNF